MYMGNVTKKTFCLHMNEVLTDSHIFCCNRVKKYLSYLNQFYKITKTNKQVAWSWNMADQENVTSDLQWFKNTSRFNECRRLLVTLSNSHISYRFFTFLHDMCVQIWILIRFWFYNWGLLEPNEKFVIYSNDCLPV